MAYIKSPLNYTGGKFKLLPVLLPAFGANINTFVDLFAGGCNVGINVDANRIVCNDQIAYLIDLYRLLQTTDTDTLIEEIRSRIARFQLTKENQAGYLHLREQYNRNHDLLDLFVLTCYSFNHQIRFNNRHEFNTPFGRNRSAYNPRMEANLRAFCHALHHKPIDFTHRDFRQVNLAGLGCHDFVYCDPPYLISTGVYNDGRRGFQDWTSAEDAALCSLLDRLDRQGVRFALSNVLRHKGVANQPLADWSAQYHVLHLDMRYANCNYHLTARDTETDEVLITNYITG